MSRLISFLLVSAVVLAGCAGAGAPKNAVDFRKAMKSGPFTRTESFEVARPFRTVSDALRKKSAECFQVSVHSAVYSTKSPVTRNIYQEFKPTFIGGAKKAELHIQRKRHGGGVHELGAPPDGYYRVVLDAVPAGSSRTRIDMYYLSRDDKYIRDALRNWVTGKNMGCPDLTRR